MVSKVIKETQLRVEDMGEELKWQSDRPTARQNARGWTWPGKWRS